MTIRYKLWHFNAGNPELRPIFKLFQVAIPNFESLFSLGEIGVDIVNSFYARKLMIEAHFGDVAWNAERPHVTLCCRPKVVWSKGPDWRFILIQPVIYALANRISINRGIATCPFLPAYNFCRENVIRAAAN